MPARRYLSHIQNYINRLLSLWGLTEKPGKSRSRRRSDDNNKSRVYWIISVDSMLRLHLTFTNPTSVIKWTKPGVLVHSKKNLLKSQKQCWPTNAKHYRDFFFIYYSLGLDLDLHTPFTNLNIARPNLFTGQIIISDTWFLISVLSKCVVTALCHNTWIDLNMQRFECSRSDFSETFDLFLTQRFHITSEDLEYKMILSVLLLCY